MFWCIKICLVGEIYYRYIHTNILLSFLTEIYHYTTSTHMQCVTENMFYSPQPHCSTSGPALYPFSVHVKMSICSLECWKNVRLVTKPPRLLQKQNKSLHRSVLQRGGNYWWTQSSLCSPHSPKREREREIRVALMILTVVPQAAVPSPPHARTLRSPLQRDPLALKYGGKQPLLRRRRCQCVGSPEEGGQTLGF